MEELGIARRDWEEPWDDRRQEIVFIGVDMPTDALRELLEACLLTDGEMEARREGWMELEDPFPGWILGGRRGQGGGRSAPGPSSLEA